MILRRYAARCLLPEARPSYIAEGGVIGQLSKSNVAQPGSIIAGRYLTTRTKYTAASTAVAGRDTGRGRGGGRRQVGREGGGGVGGEGSGGDGSITVSAASSEPAAAAPPVASSCPRYVLPPPSWSLAELKLVQRASDSDTNVDDGTAEPVLSRDEVSKLCALAHIEVGPESNSAAAAATGLDVAAVQKDVGAMLRCMRTMRGGHDERELKEVAAAAAEGGVGAAELEGNGHGGPWGGAATWAAPMQEDVVSDGAIQAQILGSAKRTEAGFFTAPRVVGGDEEAL